MPKTLVLLDLRDYQVEWYLGDDGKVYSVEKWSGDEDVVEVELGEVDEEYVINEVIEKIGEELKMPRPILGTIKAKIKQIKLPVTIRLVEEEKVMRLKFTGSKGSFEVVISYKIA